MGKKKKALLRYKRLGTIGKKLEKKFANFLRANADKFNTKIEEALTKVEETLDKTQEFIETAKQEPEASTEPGGNMEKQIEEYGKRYNDGREESIKGGSRTKTTRTTKKSTAAKKTSTTPKKTTSKTRRKRTTKTKTDS